MKAGFIICLMLSGLNYFPVRHFSSCLNEEELKLYNLITDYRRSNNLPDIPISPNLTRVAKLHVRDLTENNPVTAKCNLHSWSNKGPWKPCCYTSGHQQAKCMWDKPRELSRYRGNGYEIAFYHSNAVRAEDALKGWKSSSGHNDVILNSGIWKNITWKAVGIGIEGMYGVVWFGMEPDEENCQ